MAKKKASKKKTAPKKKFARRKVAPKKKAAKKEKPKKAAAKKSARRPSLVSSNWKVVCSVQGTIASGLTMAQAKSQSVAHQDATGHKTTYIGSQ